jgi:hypothetical protein
VRPSGEIDNLARFAALGRAAGRPLGTRERHGAQFLSGDAAASQALAGARPTSFEMVVVQPGFARNGLEPQIGERLAAAENHFVRAGHKPLRILGSD